MASKYCVCGKKTEYSVTPPVKCPSCGEPYIKAFAGSAPSTTNPVKPGLSVVRADSRPKRSMRPSDIEIEESDQYDENDVHEWAHELAASFNESDIVVSTAPPQGIKMGELVKNPDAFGHVGQRGEVMVDLPKQAE